MNGFDRLRTTSKLYYLRGNAFVRRRNQGKNNQDNNCPNTFPVVFPIYYLRGKKTTIVSAQSLAPTFQASYRDPYYFFIKYHASIYHVHENYFKSKRTNSTIT